MKASLVVKLFVPGMLILNLLCAPAQAAEEKGMPFTDGSWIMAVIPDIQSYVDHAEYVPILNQVMQWIADHHTKHNIALVLQEGDIVYQNGIPVGSMGTGDQNSKQQWENADRAFSVLDGVVPYIVVPGNHDYGVYDADARSTQFNKYFKTSDNPLVDQAHGGILAELWRNSDGELTLENAAYDFTAPDGRRMLILALEWGPRQTIVDWATEVAGRPEYASHTKVLLTHAYMYHDSTRLDWELKGKKQGANPHVYKGTRQDTHDGEELWNELVRLHAGFQLVFSGHIGGDMVGYMESENDHGQAVHQFLFNAQFLPEGGQGWIRLMEFLPDGETVKVHTYSPYFELDGDPATSPWRLSDDDCFSIKLTKSIDSNC